MIFSLSISPYFPTKLRQSRLSSDRGIGLLQSWVGSILSSLQRSTISKGIGCRCIHRLWVIWPPFSNVTTLHTVFLVLFSPFFGYFLCMGTAIQTSVQNEYDTSPSSVLALHAVERWPTVFHAHYHISRSEGNNLEPGWLPKLLYPPEAKNNPNRTSLGRPGPIWAMPQSPIQFPKWSVPHKFTLSPERAMAP